MNSLAIITLWKKLDGINKKISRHEKENYPARLATLAMIKTGHEIISDDEEKIL